jgi:hypothetical protein
VSKPIGICVVKKLITAIIKKAIKLIRYIVFLSLYNLDINEVSLNRIIRNVNRIPVMIINPIMLKKLSPKKFEISKLIFELRIKFRIRPKQIANKLKNPKYTRMLTISF